MIPIKEQLLQEIEDIPENLIKEVLDFLQFVKTKQEKTTSEIAGDDISLEKQEQQETQSTSQFLLGLLEELTEDMTLEEIAQLPKDGAEQHDHYIYGTPKRMQ